MEVKKFVVKGEIKTKQRPRATVINGHARVYPAKDTIIYENYIRSEYQRQCGDYYFGDKPLAVDVKVYFKVNKELEKYEAGDLLPCVTHKDLDNICKLVDGLNGIAWKDDKQIIDLTAHKKYTFDEERLEITITDRSPMFAFLNVKDLQKRAYIDKLEKRINELIFKPKLTKAEQKRLAEIQEEVTSYYNTRCKNYETDKN